MKKELAKTYNPHNEGAIYAEWMKRGYFHAKPEDTAKGGKTPFTIAIPPPNITSQLHIGHAFNGAIQDAIIRRKRMQGFNALWMPGTDHASIATEVKIVEAMAKEGIRKEDLGREKFLERAWKWYDEYGTRIVEQFKKTGSSCDWDRLRFTMDEGLSKAVLEVFVRLYEKGLIYRGERLVNWCSKCETSISDAEVEHEEGESGFWYFKYPVKGTNEFMHFATTRPETMLGDTAIAVNPDDERFAKFVGMTVIVPIVNREIPIIADHYVDMELGTGAVKITPAHDHNDFEVAKRNNIPLINIMNDDGTINENGASYCGLHKSEARKKIIAEFEQLGLFVKKEMIRNSVGTHDRCDEVAEPRMKLQWFVKMDTLAMPAIDALKSGKLRFVPERFGKIYLHWLENIRDWCISRQLWWGHRIPAYYCECGEITVSRETPVACPKCNGTSLRQDEDVLDTWFSSALWPFSTLGWPDKTPELDTFYPTNMLVTAKEIIFFWVVRMVFSGIEFMGEIPFTDVLINGTVLDAEGRKMSKSLGNGIDPLELVATHGADALRFSLIIGNTMGNDLRFQPEKIDAARNFLNKIWNASRFVMMNHEDADFEFAACGKLPPIYEESLQPEDKWILTKLNATIKEADSNYEHYELGLAAQRVYEFIWDEYCDWYIEMVKPRLYNAEDPTRPVALWTLRFVLAKALKLLHPIMPFITEEIFQVINPEDGSIMVADWPKFDETLDFAKEEKEVELIKEAVRGIRNAKAEMNVPPSKKPVVYVVSDSAGVCGIFERGRQFAATLGSATEIITLTEKNEGCENAVSVVIPGAEVFVRLDDLVDKTKEIERLTKERDKLVAEVKRGESKLNNQGFVAKAPQAVIAEERAKLQQYKEMLAKVEEMLRKFV